MFALLLNAPSLSAANSTRDDDVDHCSFERHEGARFVVCWFDPEAADIRLFFLNDADGAPYGGFNRLKDAVAAKGERLVFAMNAGMFNDARAPIGLYIEDGEELKHVNTNEGPGNFHLLPNGVFYLADGAAGVLETDAYVKRAPRPQYASQSGPMLVIDGDIHPRFLVESTSKKRRNGVGVTAAGEVVFALADTPVTFYQFATYFRDIAKTPNALFFDGTMSRVFAPEIGRNDMGSPIGPIVGAVVKHD